LRGARAVPFLSCRLSRAHTPAKHDHLLTTNAENNPQKNAPETNAPPPPQKKQVGRDYCYAVAPLLEDALSDRDAVHRQTASAVVMHLSLGVAGLGREDAMLHLLNLVWPNVLEQSPHVIQAVRGAVDGLRVALGPSVILRYVLQGLFHPARKVREAYWRLYNALYVASQDALVAAYPRVEDEEEGQEAEGGAAGAAGVGVGEGAEGGGGRTYARHELDIFL
jgi:uncharacterized membrane protein YgcG